MRPSVMVEAARTEGGLRHSPRYRYRPIVQGLIPWCDVTELDLRCSILLLRDQASQAVRHCSDDAEAPYSEVVRLGSIYAFGSTLSPAQLSNLRRALVHMTLAAGALDALASTEADFPARAES